MKLAVECEIDSKLKLKVALKAADGFKGTKVSLSTDEDGFVNKIRMEGPISSEEVVERLVIQDQNGMTVFHARGGEKTYKTLIEEIQMYESILALFYSVTRIRWESASSTLIPETAEEESRLHWPGFKSSFMPEEAKIQEPPMEDFINVLRMGNQSRDLTTILAFFREGKADLSTLRYISACFCFYFVLEGLYGNKKTKNEQVKMAFKKSGVLADAISRTLQLPRFTLPSRMAHIYSIDDLLRRVHKGRDTDGVIHMIVWARGDLHHFVNEPSKVSGTPFTHECYLTLAEFLHDVCLHCLISEVLSRCPRT